MKSVAQYRAVSQVGPAVLAFANLGVDGRWTGVHLGLMESSPTLTTETMAIAWVREAATAFFKKNVAKRGEENLPVVVLGLSARELSAIQKGGATAADRKIWDGWRAGKINDVSSI